jgi:hypothetical protein
MFIIGDSIVSYDNVVRVLRSPLSESLGLPYNVIRPPGGPVDRWRSFANATMMPVTHCT